MVWGGVTGPHIVPLAGGRLDYMSDNIGFGIVHKAWGRVSSVVAGWPNRLRVQIDPWLEARSKYWGGSLLPGVSYRYEGYKIEPTTVKAKHGDSGPAGRLVSFFRLFP